MEVVTYNYKDNWYAATKFQLLYFLMEVVTVRQPRSPPRLLDLLFQLLYFLMEVVTGYIGQCR